jgi:hypothetical protein
MKLTPQQRQERDEFDDLLAIVTKKAHEAADICDADPTIPPPTAAYFDKVIRETVLAQRTARHGGGPKTPEGKERSSQNAFKHGLSSPFSRPFKFLPGEDPRDFQEMFYNLELQFKPFTPAESGKIEDMAMAWFLQRRARDFQTDAIQDEDDKALSLCLRYEAHHRRSYQAAFKDFRDMHNHCSHDVLRARNASQQPSTQTASAAPSSPAPPPPARPATASNGSVASVPTEPATFVPAPSASQQASQDAMQPLPVPDITS